MKPLFVLTLLLFTCINVIYAQIKNDVTGIYSMDGVRETASGFKLNPDSTFEFYYSYGALDRYGSGKWGIKGDSVVFNSRQYPGRDFKISDSGSLKNNYTTIKIKDQNPAFYQFVYGIVKTPMGDTLYNADEEGLLILPQTTDTIKLLFELSSERISTFARNHFKANYYTLNFEPWALEVFFKRFVLHFVQGQLEGKHPLLDDNQYIYKKED